MKNTMIIVALALVAATVPAQETPQFEISFGFQAHDVEGNEDMYRSQINEDEGFILRHFSFNLIDEQGKHATFDRFRVDASGFGASPQGRIKINAQKVGTYDLDLYYRSTEHFNALADFANPFLTDGIVPGLHTLDRTRDHFDLQLTLRPGKHFRPYLGYRWTDYSGPATTTYHVGQDEFAMILDRDEEETEFRVGLAFELGTWRGEIGQGWRSFEGNDAMRLVQGAGSGINLREVLGTDINLDTFSSISTTEADTPITNLNLVGKVHERVRVSASFIKSDLESDVSEVENLMGSLASFQISRFYSGSNQTIASNTQNDQWLGKARVTIRLPKRTNLQIGYAAQHRELDGQALISTLFLDAVTFGNDQPEDFMTQLDARTYMEKDRNVLDTMLICSGIKNVSLWAGASFSQEEITVDPDLAQISAPTGQGGVFERDVDQFRLGASYKRKGLKTRIEWEQRDADTPVMRTDFLDWSRLSARIGVQLAKWADVVAQYRTVDQENDVPEIGYEADHVNYGVDLNLDYKAMFVGRISYGVFDYESEISMLRPQDFQTELSIHREDGTQTEVDLAWRYKRFELALAHSLYDSEGILSYELTRSQAELGYEFGDHLAIGVVYDLYDYSEALQTISDYEAEATAFILHWRR